MDAPAGGPSMAGRLRTAYHHVRRELYVRGLRSRAALPLPDFLGIGVPKAGTTWLHENLRRHPALFLPEAKELHYFDNRFQMPLETYSREFEAAGGRLKGEITPGYCALPAERIRVIHGLMPEARLLLCLRDPVERAWSEAVMDFVLFGQRRLEEVGDDEFRAHFAAPKSRGHGDYVGCLDRWLSFYPADRLLVLYQEDIARDPRAVLDAALAHVGAPPLEDESRYPLRRKFTEGKGGGVPDRHREFLRDLYRDDLGAMAARLGEKAAAWGR